MCFGPSLANESLISNGHSVIRRGHRSRSGRVMSSSERGNGEGKRLIRLISKMKQNKIKCYDCNVVLFATKTF